MMLSASGQAEQEQHQEVEDVSDGALPQWGWTPRSKSAHHVLHCAQKQVQQTAMLNQDAEWRCAAGSIRDGDHAHCFAACKGESIKSHPLLPRFPACKYI